MSLRENVRVIVRELLSTYGTDHVGGTRFWLLNKRRSFLVRFQLSPLLLHILVILLIQVGLILLRKFSFLLELENGGS